jgi:hypothetical protein
MHVSIMQDNTYVYVTCFEQELCTGTIHVLCAIEHDF